MDIYLENILFCRKMDLIKYLGNSKNIFDKCHFCNQRRVARIHLLIENVSKYHSSCLVLLLAIWNMIMEK